MTAPAKPASNGIKAAAFRLALPITGWPSSAVKPGPYHWSAWSTSAMYRGRTACASESADTAHRTATDGQLPPGPEAPNCWPDGPDDAAQAADAVHCLDAAQCPGRLPDHVPTSRRSDTTMPGLGDGHPPARPARSIPHLATRTGDLGMSEITSAPTGAPSRERWSSGPPPAMATGSSTTSRSAPTAGPSTSPRTRSTPATASTNSASSARACGTAWPVACVVEWNGSKLMPRRNRNARTVLDGDQLAAAITRPGRHPHHRGRQVPVRRMPQARPLERPLLPAVHGPDRP